MKKWMLWLLVVVLLAASLACSGGTTRPTAEPTEEEQTEEPIDDEETEEPIDDEETEEPVSVDAFTVTINNESPEAICSVYISGSDDDSWGDNLLNGEIGSGDSESFDVDGIISDVMIQNCDDITVDTAWELAEDTEVTVGGEGMTALQVSNESSTEVCYVYFSESGNEDWGDDWLGNKESIAAEDGQRIFYMEPGTYDLLAQDCDGEDLVEERDVDLSSDTTWTISDN